MKIVIHAGMHKTGSSAIQDHFFDSAYPGLRYARWNGGNHSGLFHRDQRPVSTQPSARWNYSGG